MFFGMFFEKWRFGMVFITKLHMKKIHKTFHRGMEIHFRHTMHNCEFIYIYIYNYTENCHFFVNFCVLPVLKFIFHWKCIQKRCFLY
jgi:hypothetical protein